MRGERAQQHVITWCDNSQRQSQVMLDDRAVAVRVLAKQSCMSVFLRVR